jgi:hypothetical protein
MKTALKLAIAGVATTIAIAALSEAAFARGGAPSIMDSPGYQRRLQESRQQLPQAGADLSSVHRHKSRHRHH